MNSSIEIFHVSQFRLSGSNGVHRSVWGMARSQAELGARVSIISIGEPPNPAEVEVAASYGVDVRSLEKVRPASVDGVLATIDREHAIFHTHGAFDVPITIFSRRSRTKGYRVVRTPHGSLEPGVFARRRMRKAVYWTLFERHSFDNATLVHLVGPTEDRTLQSLGIEATRKLIPNGMFPEDISPVEKEADLNTSLLFIARFDLEQKGLDILLPAVAAVPGLLLTLVGTDYAGGLQWLQTEVRRLGIEERVSIREPVYGSAEKRSLMASHGAFVHISRWEGLPIACLEAASSGMPLIVTPQTNLAETVGIRSAGWVVDEPSVDAAVRTLRRYLKESEEIAARGLAATQMIRDEFLWPNLAPRFLEMYHEILEQPPEFRSRRTL